MAVREANFEGQTPGTVIGIGNSSAFGDDPFTAVTVNAMTLAYGATAMHGSGGAAFGVGTGVDNATLRYGAFSNARASMRVYLRLRNYPTNEFQFCHMQNTSTTITGLNITPTGTIKVVAPGSTLVYTSSAAMSLNTWYRLEFFTTVSATAGQIRFAGYTGDATTALSGMAYDSGTAFNTGTTLLDRVEVGKITTSAVTGAFDIDDYAVSDGTAAFLGPYANVAPTVRAVVTTGSAVIDCTGTTPGTPGDTITYSISPAISPGTSQPARGIFLVPQMASAVTYTVTASESNGQSKNLTVIVPGNGGTTPSGSTPKTYTNGQWV